MSSPSRTAVKGVTCDRLVSHLQIITGAKQDRVLERMWYVRCWASEEMLFDTRKTKILVVWIEEEREFRLVRADHRGTACKKGALVVVFNSLDAKLLTFYRKMVRAT